MGFPFYKMEAVGNDFVLIEARQFPEEQRDWARLAQQLCHRPWGIGADGLLVIEPSEKAAFRLRMFNPDGTEDFCGNGLRCAARFGFEQGYVDQTHFHLEALGGVLVAVQLALGPEREVETITIRLDPPRFHPKEVPALIEGEEILDYPLRIGEQTWSITALRVGSTHTVLFVPHLPDDETFLKVSPRIEKHLLFPERTSVLWGVAESQETFRVRIWERGVGETLGCGTGACALAVAARRHGWAGEQVKVISKGGILQVRWNPGEPVELTGPACMRFEGCFHPL